MSRSHLVEWLLCTACACMFCLCARVCLSVCCNIDIFHSYLTRHTVFVLLNVYSEYRLAALCNWPLQSVMPTISAHHFCRLIFSLHSCSNATPGTIIAISITLSSTHLFDHNQFASYCFPLPCVSVCRFPSG